MKAQMSEMSIMHHMHVLYPHMHHMHGAAYFKREREKSGGTRGNQNKRSESRGFKSNFGGQRSCDQAL